MKEKAPVSNGSRATGVFLFIFGSFFWGMGALGLFSVINGESNKDNPVVGVMVGGLFILVGLGISIAGILTFRGAGKKTALAKQYPGQPWMLRKDWASGRIKDSNLTAAIVISCFALFWNGIAWTVTIGILMQGELGKEPAAYFVLLFPLVGIGLAWAAIYQFSRYRKFGTSIFELAENPGVIGGNLGGVILTKVNIKPQDGFKLSLRCIHKWTTGSGKNSSTHTETLWESEQVLHEDAMADDLTRSALPVLFFIPYECKETERLSSRAEIYWELTAKASLPGTDYKAEFRVPVFQTEASDPNATAESVEAANQGTGTVAPLPALSEIKGLTVRKDFSGGELLEFRAGRNMLFLTIPIVMGIGFAVGGYFIWSKTDAPFIFGIAFGGVGLLVAVISAVSLFTYARLLLFRDRIELETRLFGRVKKRNIPRDQITDIEAHQGMSSNNTVYYNITFHTADGQSIKAPTLIKGRREIDALIAYLKKP